MLIKSKFHWHFFFSFVLISGFAQTAASKDFDDADVAQITYPEWFIDNSFKDLQEDLAQAISQGKKGLMIMFTTQGCSYCKQFLKTSLGNPRIAELVQRNFDSMGLEIFDDTGMTHPDGTPMRVVEFASKEGAAMAPTLLFFGADGKRMFRLVGYKSPEHFENIISFIENRQPNEQFAEYLKRKQIEVVEKTAYRLKADQLFKPATFLSKRHSSTPGKPLLILFETDNCLECNNFHNDVLSLPEVRDKLSQFDVIRLDSNDTETKIVTPAGQQTTPGQWYREQALTQLPALLFYGENNEFVMKTDSVVKRQRMLNSIGLVIDKAYENGWTYQRYARTKGIERALKAQNEE